jgi:hypothetical protein
MVAASEWARHDRVRATLPPFVFQISGIKANSISVAILPPDQR